jgi:hypothetical protein
MIRKWICVFVSAFLCVVLSCVGSGSKLILHPNSPPTYLKESLAAYRMNFEQEYNGELNI